MFKWKPRFQRTKLKFNLYDYHEISIILFFNISIKMILFAFYILGI